MENIQDYINQSAKQKLWNDLNELSKIAKSCSLLDGVYAKVDGVKRELKFVKKYHT